MSLQFQQGWNKFFLFSPSFFNVYKFFSFLCLLLYQFSVFSFLCVLIYSFRNLIFFCWFCGSMVVIQNPEQYTFLRFEVGSGNKKYNAVLKNKGTGKEVRVSFGDRRYQQYKDQTGLGKYSNLNHLDTNRRQRYRTRHAGEQNRKYSSGWFSWHYLW